jgi:serine/threonine protein kinase
LLNTQLSSAKTDSSEVEKQNVHVLQAGIRVHVVVTDALDHDHAQASRLPLGQVTDEQLVAELADRDMDHRSRFSMDYDFKDHSKAIKIPLEAVTDDELLAEVDRRRLTLHEDIDESVVFETYEMGKVLGHGASGKVYLCTHRQTGMRYACKVIQKDSKMNDAQSMSTEIEIMKRLRHKHVVAMYELFESPNCLWLILELVDGGELRSFLSVNRQTYSEAHAAQHLKQILLGKHKLII